jgi:hypothetical protein
MKLAGPTWERNQIELKTPESEEAEPHVLAKTYTARTVTYSKKND